MPIEAELTIKKNVIYAIQNHTIILFCIHKQYQEQKKLSYNKVSP